MFKIAIDGPAGSGKSSISKILCAKLNFEHIDTGAMYRCLALYAYRNGIDPTDVDALVEGLKNLEIFLDNTGKVYLNGKELEEEYLSDDVVTKSDVFNDFIVPEGHFFAMGDNRTKSKDCRDTGCIPFEKLEGIVCFRFWPASEFGKID